MTTTPKRVVGYVRVSVDAPDKVSPEMQAEAIEAQCKAKGWDIVEMVVERGKSAGEGKKRPGLDRARRMIRNRKANGLVVWKIDRCSRSVRDFAEILSELRKYEADFVSVTESFDTSNAMGRAMLQITMVFAELERARMGERTAAWVAYRARQGMPPLSGPILGYRRGDDGGFEIDEEAAPIIKQAAETLIATGSLTAAANYLRDAGHPRYLNSLKTMLSSPTLTGHRLVDGVLVPGTWPPILDMETHQAVIDTINNRRPVKRGRPWTERWLLTSIAFCGRDGCGMQLGAGSANMGPGGNLQGYRCTRVRKQFLPGPRCGLQICRDELDAYVSKKVLKAITPEKWQRMRNRRQTVARPVVDTVALEGDLTMLAEEWARGAITRGEWDAARAVLIGRITEVEEATDDDDDLPELPDVSDLHKAWPSLPIEEKRLVIAAVVDRIIVLPGRPGRRRKGYDPTAERVRIIPRQPGMLS